MADSSPALNAAGLHPATRIVAWVILTAAASRADPPALLALGAVALLLAPRAPFARLFVRSRWLLLSLVLVFGLGTPGEPLAPHLGIFSPTAEGVAEGALHAWRLTFIMASLTLLVISMPTEEMLIGLYVLLHPLNGPGMGAERVATRLWLTLRYAQSAEKPARLTDWLERGLEADPAETGSMNLAIPRFRLGDAAFAGAALVLAGALLA
ncbi:MAG: hypothetical protein HYU77_08640 [Betaproteobacteria bacterium]|nr:hypothetical protein [Betaproteobacteria bacterium]